jgi:nucleotide-binding universal stress UspA family protein
MIRIQKILVGYDFSKGADRALLEAARVARKTGAEIHVVSVEVMHRDLQSMEANAATRSDKLRSELEKRWLALNGDAAGLFEKLTVHYEVLRDVAAAPAILEYADEKAVDLIVVGTHGRRGLRRMLMGSVAEEIVRKAPCTVLTARQGELKAGDDFHRTIVAPVDFSSHSLRALRHAREIADLFDHDITVVHVLEERLHPAFYNTGMFSQYDFDPDIEARTSEELTRFVNAAGGPIVRTKFEVRRGHAVREIVQVAKEAEPSMIVMATHGLTGFDHFLMGSVAEKVVRHSESPVITVKSFGRRLVEDPAEQTASANQPS